MTKKKAAAACPGDEIRMCVDMYPPRDDWERFADLACHEDPSNAAAGLAQAYVLPFSIASITAKKWANGRTLKVAFMGGTSTQQEFVGRTAAKWSEYANLRFEWGVATSSSDVRVAFQKNAGAWSFMGTDCLGISKSQPTMNLGWVDEAVVLHEFGHTLACIHEHQHPESGIPWNKDAVYKYYSGAPNYWDKTTIDHNIFGTYSRDQTQFSAYDPKSVMHYSIQAALLTDPSKAVGWNSSLSGSDMTYMGQIYPKPAVPPVPPPTSGVVRVDTAARKVYVPAGWSAVTESA